MATHEIEGELKYTDHALTRMAQRGIRAQDVKRTIKQGLKIHNGGGIFYFMRAKDVQCKADKNIEGTTVLLARESRVVLTVYKKKNGLRDIKRKVKHLSLEKKEKYNM